MDKTEEFYKKLKLTLEEDTTFPTKYLYKFIVPTSEEKINQIETIFDFSGAVITKRASRTGKFTSVSIQIIMENAASVIEKYKEAAQVEGIISL